MVRDKLTNNPEVKSEEVVEVVPSVEVTRPVQVAEIDAQIIEAADAGTAEIDAARARVQDIGGHDHAQEMELIGEGGESLVYDAKDGTVLKIGKPGYPVEFLQKNKELFELLKEHIGKFLPETQFIEALEGEDVPDELKNRPAVRQMKIEGKTLHEITEEDLNNPTILRNLIEFMKGVLSFKQEHDIMIDFYGKARDWSRPANALDSANVKIQDGVPYLIDVGLVPTELQTEQGPVTISIWNAIAGIAWAIEERSLKKYIQHIKFAVKTRYVQTVYRIVYATIFPREIRFLEKRLKKASAE